MRFFKRGILVPETLGIVLAIIGLVALGFLGFKLYNMFVDQDLKNAKAFVEDLNAKIENLADGENNTFPMRGIDGWVLVAWNKDVPIAEDGEVISKEIGKEIKPQKCFDKNCLCLCESAIANCQENGYCRSVDRNIEIKSDGFIDYSVGGGGVGPGGGFSITKGKFSFNCISFKDNNLKAIIVDKQKDIINIKFDEGYKYNSQRDDYLRLKNLACNFKGPD